LLRRFAPRNDMLRVVRTNSFVRGVWTNHVRFDLVCSGSTRKGAPMTKEISRRRFLAYSGGLLAGAMGLGACQTARATKSRCPNVVLMEARSGSTCSISTQILRRRTISSPDSPRPPDGSSGCWRNGRARSGRVDDVASLWGDRSIVCPQGHRRETPDGVIMNEKKPLRRQDEVFGILFFGFLPVVILVCYFTGARPSYMRLISFSA